MDQPRYCWTKRLFLIRAYPDKIPVNGVSQSFLSTQMMTGDGSEQSKVRGVWNQSSLPVGALERNKLSIVGCWIDVKMTGLPEDKLIEQHQDPYRCKLGYRVCIF